MQKKLTLLIIILLLSIFTVQGQEPRHEWMRYWSQVGEYINVETDVNYFLDYSVSLSSDGSVVAIGALYNEGSGPISGYVRVYTNVEGDWHQIGEDIDGEFTEDFCGKSVSLSSDGSVVAIGATGNDENGENAGHVRIYKNVGEVWTKIGLDIDGETTGDNSGQSVSLNSDGSVVAIGAHNNDGNGINSGHVRIYKNVGEVWTKIGLDIDGEATGDNSGQSVSLNSDGSVVAIGAYNNDGNGENAGHVRIYRNIAGTWSQIGNDIDGKIAGDHFGQSVSINSDGSVVAIGAPQTSPINDYGYVQIYRNVTDSWIQVNEDINLGDYITYGFGHSVSISADGSMVAIGTAWDNFVRICIDISEAWHRAGYDIIDEQHAACFGRSVSLNSDGSVVAIGEFFNSAIGDNPGRTGVFTSKGVVSGIVNNDINMDCEQNEGEQGLSGRRLLINPGNIIVTTGEEGNWHVSDLPIGNYTIEVDTSGYWLPTCPVTQNFTVTELEGSLLVSDFGFVSTLYCSEPNISINMPTMRPCFANQIIYIQACNHSTAPWQLTDAYVEVELDTLFTLASAELAYTDLGNNLFRFDLGTLNPGQCSNFWIKADLSCDANLGQTLCLKADLFPAEDCVFDTIPTPGGGGVSPCELPWDKSSLNVEGVCRNDSVVFTITNTGDFGDGDMECYTPVRIYIDGEIIILDSIQLFGGEEIIFSYEGDGITWRLEADQHPLHPGNSNPNASVEACGVLPNWTPGLINIFPLNDADPVTDIYCGFVTGSYDPNDKAGTPLGIGTGHWVYPNGKIDYLIRFQNTGTDTAFTVVIRDTLEMDLDIFSVKSGSSSHNYTFKMHGPRVLEWTFNNILLPDSFINEPASNGFVSFTVNQNADLPDGTEITNTADIYFDFNAPVITNTSIHKIDRNLSSPSWTEEKTVTEIVCDVFSYNDYSYTQSGTFWQISKGVADTLVTINLTVKESSFSEISENVCETYTAPDNSVYTETGIYTAIIPNSVNCDSTITISLTVNEPSSSEINETVCGTPYTAPDNSVYTETGIYTAVIPNSANCDSTITINLTVNEPTASQITETVCQTYTAPDNSVYTETGVYTVIIPNSVNCDSTITINLTVNEPSSFEINETVCGTPYTAPDNSVYTETGIYTAVIPNSANCDSTITINLTVNEPSSSEITETVCGTPYTAPDNSVYTETGIYTAVIQNSVNCDSTITIILTVNEPSSSEINETVCQTYTAPDNSVYTETGIYTAVIPNSANCDSVITINLSVVNPDITVTENDPILIANNTSATYQWVDCDNGNLPINGETAQEFTASENGNYAVMVTQSPCESQISDCVAITSIGILENSFGKGLTLFPNPTENGNITIDLGKIYEEVDVKIINIKGKEVLKEEYISQQKLTIKLDAPAGVYFVTVSSENQKAVFRLVKN